MWTEEDFFNTVEAHYKLLAIESNSFPLTPTYFCHNKKVSDEITLQSDCSITTVWRATSRRAETKIQHILMVILIRFQRPVRFPMIRCTSYDQLTFYPFFKPLAVPQSKQDSVSREREREEKRFSCQKTTRHQGSNWTE